MKQAKRIFLVLAALLLTAILTVAVCAENEPAADPADTVEETVPVEDAEAEADAAGIEITLERLPANLARMGIGMLCIVIVMGILILVTVALNKVTSMKKEEEYKDD